MCICKVDGWRGMDFFCRIVGSCMLNYVYLRELLMIVFLRGLKVVFWIEVIELRINVVIL